MSIENLEDYLVGEFHQDMDDIAQLEETLERTANVFVLAQDGDGAWPYLYRQSEGRKVTKKVSHGTQAMIAVALSRMIGSGVLASGKYARLKLTDRDDVRVSYALGVKKLVKELDGNLRSGSFGLNDPVTLSHFADFIHALSEADPCGDLLKGISKAIDELHCIAGLDPRTASTRSDDSESLLRHLPEVKTLREDEASTEPEPFDKRRRPQRLLNAFVPLRIVRSVVALRGPKDTKLPTGIETSYRRFFEATLHEQLSYSDIPDSRFDPAELIFCLEGLILIAPNAVDDRLLDRVLHVLEAKQDESAHWRPSRPIYATHQGMTMLPVSVEGAVSLMRSIAIKDRRKDFQPLSVRTVPMARRFWKWLQARAVRLDAEFSDVAAADSTARENAGVKRPLKAGSRRVCGWHSEHVNDPELIHLWDTSQVAEFMLAYRELLQRAVAGRTLRLSGLKINKPARERPRDPKALWDSIVERFEPLIGSETSSQVYKRIGAQFFQPWLENTPGKASSMMLYGPPGTGKSTVGENLADALGMRMITVTVSDFLGRGGAFVEARAKAIFQTLEAQFDSIILFDEIDTFLLDRDSKRYDRQDTLFQFLTPGMLTKINDLHKLARSIFIIATNYKNRIDPAIQRKGRIDQHYLLALPDKERRKRMLLGEMGLEAADSIPEKLLQKTAFFGYSDIKAAVDDAKTKGLTIEAVAAELEDPARAPATVGAYIRRVGIKKDKQLDWSDFPFNEFEGLVDLYSEVHASGSTDNILSKYQDEISTSVYEGLREKLEGSEKRRTLKTEKQNV